MWKDEGIKDTSSSSIVKRLTIAEVITRSVAQCDSIIMDSGQVSSIPEVSALHPDD